MTEPSLMVVTVVAVVGEEPIKEKSPWLNVRTWVQKAPFFYSSNRATSELCSEWRHMTTEKCVLHTAVFPRFRTFDNTPTQLLFAKCAYTYRPGQPNWEMGYTMWKSDFFCYSDFTWNQFWSFWSPKNCCFDYLSGSEFWILEKFHTWKCQMFPSNQNVWLLKLSKWQS